MYILYFACYPSPRSLWITRREEGLLCPPVCKSRSWRAHIQEHGNDIGAQDLWWSFIVYKSVIISYGCKTNRCWKRHLWRQRPSQQDRPLQTPARARRRSFSDKKKPFSHRKCSSYSQSVTWLFKPYLESSKLADVSEHLVVVKIPPPHPHWEAFPGLVKKNSLMLE